MRITNEIDLHNLAINGLGLDDLVVGRCVHNRQPYITLAVLDVLKEWRKTQVNFKIAYRRLYQILINVEMSVYAETLKDLK